MSAKILYQEFFYTDRLVIVSSFISETFYFQLARDTLTESSIGGSFREGCSGPKKFLFKC